MWLLLTLKFKDMIKYVIQAKKNPLKKNEVKYYPQMAPTTPMSLAQIVKRVEKRSTVSSADVKAVLDALHTKLWKPWKMVILYALVT